MIRSLISLGLYVHVCIYIYVLVVISCKFNKNRVYCISCDIEQNRYKKEIEKSSLCLSDADAIIT